MQSEQQLQLKQQQLPHGLRRTDLQLSHLSPLPSESESRPQETGRRDAVTTRVRDTDAVTDRDALLDADTDGEAERDGDGDDDRVREAELERDDDRLSDEPLLRESDTDIDTDAVRVRDAGAFVAARSRSTSATAWCSLMLSGTPTCGQREQPATLSEQPV
jgi:hypothetical protein